MSSKAKSSKFSYTPANNLPKLPKKIPTQWDMKGLYYKSINDPQIEKDVQLIEKLEKDFAKKFKGSDFCTNPKTLKRAFDLIGTNSLNPRVARPTRYLGLLSALDTQNEAVSKKLNLFSERITKAGNQNIFFWLELAKVPKETQKLLLASKELANHTYQLQSIFETAKYDLSEAEEKTLRLLGNVSYGMWVEATEKMLGSRSVTYKEESIPLNAAFDRVSALPFKEQPKLWRLIMDEVAPLAEFVEHELTAVCTKKKITDELRGYKTPYSASVIAHEDDENSVTALVDAVSTKGFDLSKRFYKLKAKLHGVDQISYAQRSASIGTAPVIDFTQATEICRDVFYGVNETYGELFDKLLINGQIDVYPQAGKSGGAFCSGDIAQPTQVFLNQTDTLRSLETYAHEMGHAIHTERSKVQPTYYQGYSTTTAETASTLFEGLLFDAVLEQADASQKAVLLHDKLCGDIATIQRQIAFHNFELAMHEHVKAQGAISHKELNTLMQTHLRAYCGPGVEITEIDGHSYIYVAHFRYGFYVYTYTFGMLMSSIMAENVTQDSAYAAKIDQFLTAGGSDTVTNIFKSIGINAKKIETFESGLDKMAAEIKLLQKLTK